MSSNLAKPVVACNALFWSLAVHAAGLDKMVAAANSTKATFMALAAVLCFFAIMFAGLAYLFSHIDRSILKNIFIGATFIMCVDGIVALIMS